ncbi:MAG: alanine racemase [Bacteroidetes bacterium]|nr:MAG: alanine racemase [Bacteroidota bacterium]
MVAFARWQEYTLLQPGLTGSTQQWLTIGSHANCSFRVMQMQAEGQTTIVSLCFKETTQTLRLPFTNPAQVENALMCVAVAWWMGIPQPTLQQAVNTLYPVDMRLQWKRGINHCQLLNDGYTSDLASLKIALDYLTQQKQGEKLTLILSDFSAPADASAHFYAQVLNLIKRYGISRLVAVGPRLAEATATLAEQGMQVHCFYSTAQVIEAIPTLNFSAENILVKGARVFAFENLVQALQQQAHETELTINLNAVAQRLAYYRGLLQPDTKIMVMLKAFGYGSGVVEIARLLQFSGVHYLAVAYTDEGVALRQAGIHLPIMVMNPEPAGFALLEQYNLEPELYDFGILNQFLDWCRQQGSEHFPVHIKLDTGMHRLGFLPEAIHQLLPLLTGQRVAVIKSVFTHLVAAEDAAHDAYTAQQAATFNAAASRLEAALGYGFMRHLCNTAAIARHPALHAHMVRLGIGLYAGGQAGLPAALCLTTRIAQLKWVPQGQTVGYGRTQTMAGNTLVATVRIGYADGYRRQLGNGIGYMLVRGHRAAVVGRVCMDMTMIDVTHVPNVAVGDAVEVFGPNLPLEVVAQQCGTIIYEIITGIGQRVKRVYHSE